MPGGAGGPPGIWRGVLRRIVPRAELDVVEGELREGFEVRRDTCGQRFARGWYRRQVMGYAWRAVAIRSVTPKGEEGTKMGLFTDVWSDVRWALRSLWKRPTFAAVAIATLALGIGANSAIFTLVSAHFLTPLPYDRPSELVLLWETERNSMEVMTVSPGNYWTWREEAESFVDIAAFNVDFATLSGEPEAERVNGSLVAPHFFELLGVTPLLGNTFDARAAAEADGELVILSHSLWTRRYAQDPTIVGRDVRIDGRPHTVVGVLPAAYRQPERSLSWQGIELWRPLLLEAQRNDHGSRFLRTIARRKPDVSVEQARLEMDALAARLREAFPTANTGRNVLVRTLDDYLMGAARPILLMLLVAGGAVLLIVCANVANLTLARGEERRSEFAVRAALGSGSARLLRQVVVEGVVLALAGAVVGTLAVFAAKDVLQIVQERYFTGLIDVSVDWRVIGLTTALAILAGVLFGLPLARSAARPELRAALGEGGQRGHGRSGAGALRNTLIIGQVGLATTLLVAAALLSRSFNELVSTPPGFEATGVVTFTVSAPAATYPTPEEFTAYHREVLREVEGIPGVRRVGRISDLPFTTENMFTGFVLADRENDPNNLPSAEYHVADAGYFDVMEIAVLRGQTLPEGPVEGEIPVVINEHMAQWLWPEGSELGARFDLVWNTTIPLRVTGIAANVLDDGYDASTEPVFFVPMDGLPRRRMSYVLRVAGDPGEVLRRIRPALARVDPDIPASDLRLFEHMMAETVARPRAASLIGMTFALIALLVAAAGIYGVLSYSVQSRTREIGIRTALGATGREIVSMVMGRSTVLLATGLAAGIGGALLAGRTLSGLLYGVRVWDPLSLLAAVVVLGGVGTLAAWLPARRAVRIDPREALRAE